MISPIHTGMSAGVVIVWVLFKQSTVDISLAFKKKSLKEELLKSY